MSQIPSELKYAQSHESGSVLKAMANTLSASLNMLKSC